MKKILLLCFLFFPVFVLASYPIRPGTDDFLKQKVGLTDEQLSFKAFTEDREAFSLETSARSVYDPIGDVLTRTGTTSPLGVAWADLTSVQVQNQPQEEVWTITFTTAADVPKTPTEEINFIFYVDADGNQENNDTDGIRIQTDAGFLIKFDTEKKEWFVDYRWYNKEADFWAFNKTTESKVAVGKNLIRLKIPHKELTKSWTPAWRAACALNMAETTEIDVVPGIGFPPPKEQTYPISDFDIYKQPNTINDFFLKIIFIIILGIIGFFVWKFHKKNK